MIEAAIIADRFGIDPVQVLTERDPWALAARAAAAHIIHDAEEKARREAEAKANSRRH